LFKVDIVTGLNIATASSAKLVKWVCRNVECRGKKSDTVLNNATVVKAARNGVAGRWRKQISRRQERLVYLAAGIMNHFRKQPPLLLLKLRNSPSRTHFTARP
jgi:hypothetical protein